MSWNVSAGGTGEGAAEMAAKQFDTAKSYSSSPAKALLEYLNGAVREFAKAYPSHTLVIDSSGHMDDVHGFANLSLKTYNSGH